MSVIQTKILLGFLMENFNFFEKIPFFIEFSNLFFIIIELFYRTWRSEMALAQVF